MERIGLTFNSRMKSTFKTVSLESRFPLLSVEDNCIISKSGDVTVAFAVELPELFTLTGAEYESLHGA